MHNNSYDTLSMATTDLARRGYSLDLNLAPDGLEDRSGNRIYPVQELLIDEYHRFEGDSSPGDMSVVYAISTSDGPLGVLIEAYGGADDPQLTEVLSQLRLQKD